MSNTIICEFHDTQDHRDDYHDPTLPRRTFTLERDVHSAVEALTKSCLNWSMEPTRLECGPNQLRHSVEYRGRLRVLDSGVRLNPAWELVTFTGPQEAMLPLLKLAAHHKVIIESSAAAPKNATIPALVLGHMLRVPFDSPEFVNVIESCKIRRSRQEIAQGPDIVDLAARFASMLLGEPPAATATTQGETALELAS